jgi:hypothetical protein
MSRPDTPEPEHPAHQQPEPVDGRRWRPTTGTQPGSVQRSLVEPSLTVRPESATSEFGNPGGLWLG